MIHAGQTIPRVQPVPLMGVFRTPTTKAAADPVRPEKISVSSDNSFIKDPQKYRKGGITASFFHQK